jgi:hypothetical protein
MCVEICSRVSVNGVTRLPPCRAENFGIKLGAVPDFKVHMQSSVVAVNKKTTCLT